MKKVVGITINFNSEEETVACLQSLAKLDLSGIDFSFIVVDNDSQKESQEFVAEHLANTSYPFKIEFLISKDNSGFSGGNNKGIKKALAQGADYILIMNNDTVVDKDLVRSLLGKFDEDSSVGIVSPKIYFYKGSEFHKDRYKDEELGKVIWYAGGKLDWNNIYGSHIGVDEVDTEQFDNSCETEFATGCCMLIKKEVFEKIGYFDEAYFLYFEDIDLCMRTKKAGFAIYYEPKGIMWHKNAGSTGGSGSNLQDYYMSRNRLLFGYRYAGVRTKIALSREALTSMISGRKWQKKGIQDYFFHNLGKGTYSP